MRKFSESLFVFLIFICTGIFSQDIGTPWIDVRGKSNKEIEVLLRKEVASLGTYDSEIVEETSKKLQDENSERSIDFNNKKVSLRSALNSAIDEKNDFSIEVNDLKDQLALNQSEISALKQKIADADSSSEMSKQLIAGEKARIKDELSKIPFYEVLIARVALPENANVSDYDNKMSHEISKLAIESQLGLEIIKRTIIKDGTLSENVINTSLLGKANSNLTLKVSPVKNEETGRVSFERYRYGLVTVYPFQEDDISLDKNQSTSNIDVNVEIVSNIRSGIAENLPDDEKRKLNKLLNDKIIKNSDSESQIKRLARNSKRLILLENGKIKRNNQSIKGFKGRMDGVRPIVNDYKNQLELSKKNYSSSVTNFTKSNSDYENHIFSESYVEVFPREGYTSADKSITEKYIEFAIDSYQEFLTSIKSEYLKEDVEVTQNSYREIRESKKTDVVLNKIKLLGKFAKERNRKTELSIYIAYNFSFKFEQAKDLQLTASSGSSGLDWYEKGYDALERKDYDNAIFYNEKAIELDPTDVRYYHNLGYAYHNKGNIVKAIEYYKKAIKLEPNETTYTSLGNIYMGEGSPDNANDYYEKAAKIREINSREKRELNENVSNPSDTNVKQESKDKNSTSEKGSIFNIYNHNNWYHTIPMENSLNISKLNVISLTGYAMTMAVYSSFSMKFNEGKYDLKYRSILPIGLHSYSKNMLKDLVNISAYYRIHWLGFLSYSYNENFIDSDDTITEWVPGIEVTLSLNTYLTGIEITYIYTRYDPFGVGEGSLMNGFSLGYYFGISLPLD